MEPIILVLSIYALVLLAFSIRIWRKWRDVARERVVSRYCRDLIGRRAEDATELLGAPFSIMRGSERTLYEWKSPPSKHFPSGSGLLIFYVIANASGWITDASWQTRTESRWRSGKQSSGP